MTKRKRGANSKEVVEQDGRIQIKKAVFLDALTKVKPGLANKEIMEQSVHFILDQDRIWTYNDQLAISHEIRTGITGAVRAVEFHALIQKIEGELIWFEQQQGQILIETESAQATINIEPDIKAKSITVPGINSKQWAELPKNFSTAVRACLFSVCKALDRPALNCLYVSESQVISSDRHRCTWHALDAPVNSPFLLPFVAAKEIHQYNPYKVYPDKKWIHFVNRERTFFSCRTIDEPYPVEQVMGAFNTEGEQLPLPNTLNTAVEFAGTILVEDFALDKFVTLSVEPGLITCGGRSDLGQASQKIEYDNGYTGERIDVLVNPVFLNEIIDRLQTVIISDRLLFEGEGFKHAIVLSSGE